MTGVVRLANCMVRRLHAEAERYFSARDERPANYEDLFYLAKQALDEERGEMENPAIRSFVNQLKADMLPLINDANAPLEQGIPSTFKELLDRTCNYIADIVWGSLCRKPKSTDHLEIFAEACRCGHVVGISTLCHDKHVEDFLTDKEILLSDGFADEESGVRYWNGDFSLQGRIPFLKLHGSVNWFRVRPGSSEDCYVPDVSEEYNDRSEESGDWSDDRIGIPLSGDHYRMQTAKGVLQVPLDGRPMLLIGTFNKISEYSRGVFLDLYYHFRTTLNEASKLVICGYSFGDKGINSEITGWYSAEEGRRLVVIDPNPTELVASARRAIANKWCKWEKQEGVEFIAKRLEEVGTDEFLRSIR